MRYLLPHEIKAINENSPGLVNKYYSYARKIANRQIARLQKRGLTTRAPIGTIKEVGPEGVPAELAEVYRFFRDPRHTIAGAKEYRQNVLESLRQRPGYGFINESNFNEWAEFMELMRERYGSKLYDSGDATDVFQEIERLNIPVDMVKKHFNLVMDNYEKLAAGDPIVNAKNPGRAIRFTDLKNAIKEANAR